MPARGRAKTVGVFGPASIETVATIAATVPLDVVQLHGDPTPGVVERIRPFFAGEVWAVVRIAGRRAAAGGVGAAQRGRRCRARREGDRELGGTGATFDWEAVARTLDRQRVRSRIVLAGGLTHENVAQAVRIVAPDVVDVSSGVESAPGIKDHSRMRAFSDALRPRGETQ